MMKLSEIYSLNLMGVHISEFKEYLPNLNQNDRVLLGVDSNNFLYFQEIDTKTVKYLDLLYSNGSSVSVETSRNIDSLEFLETLNILSITKSTYNPPIDLGFALDVDVDKEFRRVLEKDELLDKVYFIGKRKFEQRRSILSKKEKEPLYDLFETIIFL